MGGLSGLYVSSAVLQPVSYVSLTRTPSNTDRHFGLAPWHHVGIGDAAMQLSSE